MIDKDDDIRPVWETRLEKARNKRWFMTGIFTTILVIALGRLVWEILRKLWH